jgi:hypothetical protein
VNVIADGMSRDGGAPVTMVADGMSRDAVTGVRQGGLIDLLRPFLVRRTCIGTSMAIRQVH